MNEYVRMNEVGLFSRFSNHRSDAAATTKTDVLDMCEGASVFGHVKSQSIG